MKKITNWSKSKISAEEFRKPMSITTLRIYRDKTAYYECPRCGKPLERDYQAFCECCGQAIKWYGHKKAKKIYV